MNKKQYFLIAGAVIAISAIVIFFGTRGEKSVLNPNAEMIYFHGKGCSHCAIVEEFVKKNKVDDVVKMEKAEIFFNKKNQEVFQEKAGACGIPEKERGVPMLWTDGKCLVGDKDIISYFETKLNKKSGQ